MVVMVIINSNNKPILNFNMLQRQKYLTLESVRVTMKAITTGVSKDAASSETSVGICQITRCHALQGGYLERCVSSAFFRNV